jgi:hypothetical protein
MYTCVCVCRIRILFWWRCRSERLKVSRESSSRLWACSLWKISHATVRSTNKVSIEHNTRCERQVSKVIRNEDKTSITTYFVPGSIILQRLFSSQSWKWQTIATESKRMEKWNHIFEYKSITFPDTSSSSCSESHRGRIKCVNENFKEELLPKSVNIDHQEKGTVRIGARQV